jgi:hypothetical protein
MRVALAVMTTALLLAGCAPKPQGSSRDLGPESAEPRYWLNQPPVALVVHDDFNQLWNACRAATRARSFTVDRSDLRAGLLTSFPQVSKQFFEFWRNDAGTLPAVLESSLATVRRTVRFEVRRREDGEYEAVPKVLVERYSQSERRVTSVARYAEIFTIENVEGSRTRDKLGADLPEAYWYAVGRDTALELQIANDIRSDLRS